VLYLDYDGVLHPEDVCVHPRRGIYVRSPAGHALFEHAPLLEALLAPYPHLAIVLSTSWARVKGYTRARDYLAPELRQRVIGATFHSSHMRRSEFLAMPRGLQVWNDVVRRQPECWLALDDTYQDWPAWCADRLVRTHEVLGISDPQTHKALEYALRAHFSESSNA